MYIDINKEDIQIGDIIKIQCKDNTTYIGLVQNIMPLQLKCYIVEKDIYEDIFIDNNDIKNIQVFSENNFCLGYVIGGHH